MKRNVHSQEFPDVSSAAAAVKAGDSIWFNGNASATAEFARALSDRRELKNVTIVSTSYIPAETLSILEGTKNIKFISGMGGAFTQVCESNRAYILKATAPTIVNMLCREFKINTVITQTSYPVGDGRCALPSKCAALTAAIASENCIAKRIAILSDEICPPSELPGTAELTLDSFELVCEMGYTKQVSIA